MRTFLYARPLAGGLIGLVFLFGLAGCGESTTGSHERYFHIDDQQKLVIEVPNHAPAVIDKQHRLFIGDTPIALNEKQRADAARYYEAARRIQRQGGHTGWAGARFAARAVSTVFSHLASGHADGIDDAVDSAKQQLLASVASLCSALSHTSAAQAALARDVPRFAPYQIITADSVDECHDQIARKRQTG